MLRKIFNLFNRDLTGKTWSEEKVHPYLGRMTLFAQRDNDQSYWECAVEFESEEIFIGVKVPNRTMPSNEQVQFLKDIMANPDIAFEKASPILIPEFETWHKQRFPKSWREAFKLVGVIIPAEANEMNPWELSFESKVDTVGHQFTCYFENGIARGVSVDG